MPEEKKVLVIGEAMRSWLRGNGKQARRILCGANELLSKPAECRTQDFPWP